jgi:polyisoprenoid-binding protein YceI
MTTTHLAALAVVAGLSTAFAMVQSSTWTIAPNYVVKFKDGNVEGTFSALKGAINFDENDLQNSKMEIELEVSTIKTGNATMEEHATSKGWFDAATYPKITFNSTGFAKKPNGYAVQGDLVMHGTKKSVSIPFTFVKEGGVPTFKGSFKVNRKDYGINGTFMQFMVGNEVTIDLKVPVKE